ncbi:MAG: sulfotransferase family protein [Actinomycetota bacterium]
MTQGPVFVAGMERSGTSLLFALLGSHPDIAMTRRTNLWRYVYGQYGDLADPRQLDRCLADLRRYKRLVVLDLDFDSLRRQFGAGPPTYPRLFELIWRQVADREGKPRWGDKSLMTERFADLIFDSYPGARILHMIRDPRDRFASVQARWGNRLGGVGAGAAEWMQSAHLALSNQRRHPHGYRVVRYEDLVSDPEGALGGVCEFIDAPWSDRMLEMTGAGEFREAGGNSSYGRRRPGAISPDSIGRYRTVLHPTQVEFLELTTGETMRRLGYLPGGASAPRTWGRARYPMETLRYVGWQAREAIRARRSGGGIPGYRLLEVSST